MSFLNFFKGFLVTGKQPFKPKVTVQYPEEKRLKPERFHGRHVLNRYEDGMEKCIGCELCAGVCPAHCIYVRGADNPPDDPVSPGERYGFVYEINFLRCIHCDLCVEACPTEAITESKMFEFSFTNREDAIYTKSELVVDDAGRPQVLPWEDWNPGDELHTSAWVRATAPGGSAAMEGRPLWSAELGYGVRPAQLGQSDPQAADITADTDQSLREMLAPALEGIGVRTVRPVRSARSTGLEAATPSPPSGVIPPAGAPAAPTGATAAPADAPPAAGSGGAG
jgi:NADH-quinone oxidoreductase subunit I